MLVEAPCVPREGHTCWDDVLQRALGSLCKYRRCVSNVGAVRRSRAVALNTRQTEDNDQKSGPCLSFLVVSFHVSFTP